MRFSLTVVVCCTFSRPAAALTASTSAGARQSGRRCWAAASSRGRPLPPHHLRGNPAVNIGHATTHDFIHWTLQPPVLAPGPWDTLLWAPCLIQPSGNAWFMYYTGVNVTGAQQTGVAFSNDLYNWIKYPDPVYHPDTTWAIWNSDTFLRRSPRVI